MNDFKEYSAAFYEKNYIAHKLNSDSGYSKDYVAKVRSVFNRLKLVESQLTDEDVSKIQFILRRYNTNLNKVMENIPLDKSFLSDSELNVINSIANKYKPKGREYGQTDPFNKPFSKPEAPVGYKSKKQRFVESREKAAIRRRSGARTK